MNQDQKAIIVQDGETQKIYHVGDAIEVIRPHIDPDTFSTIGEPLHVPAFIIGMRERNGVWAIAYELLTNGYQDWASPKVVIPCEHRMITSWRPLVIHPESVLPEFASKLDGLIEFCPIKIHPCYGDADKEQRLHVLTEWINHAREARVICEHTEAELMDVVTRLV